MTHKIVKLPKHASTAAFQDVQPLPQHHRRTMVAVALTALVALLGVLARPSPPSLSTMVTGDAALAARAQPLLHGALDRVSIAVVDAVDSGVLRSMFLIGFLYHNVGDRG
jgi:hypothetical protein